MTLRTLTFEAALCVALALAAHTCVGANFLENFDIDPTPNWTVNDNGAGKNAANFFFDYSTVGIPPAPHSAGTTRGLKLGVNLDPAVPPLGRIFPGISVSPTGQSFSGNYRLRFDWWENFIGPLNVGALGSSQWGEFGILTSGTTANYPGAADGTFFTATGDGQLNTDFGIHSPERPSGYVPFSVNPIDAHGSYAASGRDSGALLYTTTFPAGATAPGTQASDPTQTSSTPAGAAGFRWHDVVIDKNGPLVSWTVDSVLLGTVDTSLYTVPTGGSNILFGRADFDFTTNSSVLMDRLEFTLVDNVRVVPEPTIAVLCLSFAATLLGLRRRR